MTRLTRIGCLVIVAILGCVSAARADILIAQYSPQANDRFYAGSDKAFIGDVPQVSQALDFSGVGKTSNSRWMAMVSPSYFLSAAHYAPTFGSTVTFYEDNTTDHSHTYTVASWSYQTNIPGLGSSDLYLGKLTAPISANDHIAQYAIPMLGGDSAYIDQSIYVYGLPNRVGTNTIADIFTLNVGSNYTRLMEFDYDPSVQYNAFVEPGDSGGPSFLLWNGQLALVGTHYVDAKSGTTPLWSGDSFVPYYADQLNAHMTGEHLTLTPEPPALVLLLSGAVIGLLFVWRGRRRAARSTNPRDCHRGTPADCSQCQSGQHGIHAQGNRVVLLRLAKQIKIVEPTQVAQRTV